MQTTSLPNADVTRGGENERAHKLVELLQRFDALLFITAAADGGLGIRPMQVVRSSDRGVLWFIADRDTFKVKDALQQGEVHLAGQSDDGVFIAARGRPEIHTDEQTKNRLWSDDLRVWFPEGKTDPRLCFIRVIVEEGEYWDTLGAESPSNVFAKIFGPYARGETPDVDASEPHGKTVLVP